MKPVAVFAVILSLALAACSADDSSTATDGEAPSEEAAKLALALQSVGSAAPTRALLPLDLEANEADLVGVGRIVGVQRGPRLLAPEPVPGLSPQVTTVVVQIDVQRLAEDGSVSPRRLSLLRVGRSVTARRFADVGPLPVAFFWDVVTLSEFARSAGLSIDERASSRREALFAEPSQVAAVFVEDSAGTAFPLLTSLDEDLTSRDRSFLEEIGFRPHHFERSALFG